MTFYHVSIHYGPCRSLNDVIHRPRKLYGIRVYLQKLGYRVDFVKESWRDYCILELCGREVFRCNVKHLKFNTSVERDPVAQRAVDAVVQATHDCLRARTFLWIRQMILEEIFTRSELAPKDYWPFDVFMTPFSFDCKTCCNMLFPNGKEVAKPPSLPISHRRPTTDEASLLESVKKTKIRF